MLLLLLPSGMALAAGPTKARFAGANARPRISSPLLVIRPDITSFNPSSGRAGTTVVLTGTDLTNATLTVNGVSVTPTATASSSLTFVVPAGAGPTQSITATTGGGTSAASTAFTVQLGVSSTSPGANARTAPLSNSALALTFSEAVTSASASAGLKVFSAQLGGKKAGTVTLSGNTASFAATAGTPRTNFAPGEVVNVSVPATVANASGLTSARRVYQFTAAVAGTGRGKFTPQSTTPEPPVGANPFSVALGDVDGDGNLDLLTTNLAANTVSVRLNNGTGGFTAPATDPEAAVGRGPRGLALGDVDGDGDLDLLVANYDDNAVSVRLNNGTGSFPSGSVIGVGTKPLGVALGDVDGDGDLDVLTANLTANTVSVRLNDGTGVFTAPAPAAVPEVAVGTNPYSVALGDVDGDGDLDFIAANQTGGTLSVRLNNGAGVFTAPATTPEVAVGSYPSSVAMGDLDGDGDLDVVTANYSVNTASVRLNNGTGRFTAPTTNAEVAVGPNAYSVALGDVDGDGDLDLVTGNNGNATASIRLNNGTGVFSAPTTIPEVAVGTNPYSVALGDLDNDGDLDLVTANNGNSGTASVRLNQPPTLTISSVAPNPGGLGQSITITGTGMASPTALTINGANALANIVSNSGTSLVVRVPATATATGNVSLTTAGGTATSAFALMPAPGNALAFDGVDDYVALPSGLNTASFTFEAWVKYQDNGVFTRIFDFGTSQNTWMMLTPKASYAGNSGNLGFGIVTNRNAAAESTILSNTPLPVGRWQHVAVTLATSGTVTSGTLYLNGQVIGTTANLGVSPTDLGTLTNSWLGRSQFSSPSFSDPYLKGSLDEVRIWSTARTQAQVQADMLAPAPATYPAGLQFYLNTDQGTPATASTGNNVGLTTLYDQASAQAAVLNNFALTSGNTTSNYVESYAMVVPTATAATSRSTSGFTANWTAPALGTVDNGYRLDVSTSSTFASAISGSPFTLASGTTSQAVTGLPGTTYYYRVRADKTLVTGQGAYSDVISATTTTLTPPGNALGLDGANDYVRIPDSNALDFGTGDFTVEAWVLKQANSSSYSNAVGPGGKWNTGASPGTNEWLLQTTAGGSDNLPSFLLEIGTTIYAANGTVPVPLNRWTHLAGVRQGGSLLLYVNGVLQATTTIPAGAAVNNITGRDLLLGAIANNTTAAYFANERLDELRIWNVARTAAQLLAGMLNVATVPQTSLVAYYNFDQGIAGGTNQTVLPDLTSNGNNGTLNNFDLTSGNTASNYVESYAMVVPTATAATSTSTADFVANWTAPAVGTVTSYLVDVATDAGFTAPVSGSPFAVAAPTLTQAMSGLTYSTTYYYRVRADKTSVPDQGASSKTITVTTCGPMAITQNASVALDVNGNATVPATAVNNGSTVACGAVAGTNTLNLAPATFSCADAVPATVASALLFDGSSQYVEGTNALLPLGNAARTIEAWVYPNSSSVFGAIFNYGTPNTNQRAALLLSPGNKLYYAGEGNDLVGNTVLSLNTWHHVAATYNGTTLKLYVDGVLDASATQSAFNTTGTIWRIAQRSAPQTGEFMSGGIDEVRVWNVTRTAAQVYAAKGAGLPGNTAGLVAYYRLNEGSGLIVADATASAANQGTLYNGPTWTTAASPVVNGVPVALTVTDANTTTNTATAIVTVSVPPTPTTTWNGASTTSWTGCGNWSFGKVPDATTNVVIPTSQPLYPNLSTGTLAVQSLTLNSGSSLTLGSGATLQVSGDFANNGTATLAGTVAFVGSAATQALGGSTATAFTTVAVNKPTGTVQLGHNLALGGALTLAQGTLTTTPTYQVTLGSAASLSETDASYVVGQVAASRSLASSQTETFGGMGLSLTPAAGSTSPGLTVATRTTGTALTGVGNSVSVQRYFDIVPTVNTGLNVAMTFAYFPHELNGIPAANLALYKSVNGPTGPWSSQRPITMGTNTVSKTGISDFSVWTLGNSAVPLPVELSAFTATLADNAAVRLAWATASEKNSAAFEVERSTDGTAFDRLGTVAAAGSSSAPRAYAWLDSKLPASTATLYYRLRLLDLDGTASYSAVRSITLLSKVSENSLLAYPNPAHNAVRVRLLNGVLATAPLQVFDALGRLVRTQPAPAPGTEALLPLGGLPTGFYVLRCGALSQRLTVE